MSKAEDLLNSLSDEEIMMYSTAVGEEGHIIIGSDRTVTVPDELKKIAVQYDHNVETVTFDCPRYSDGVDMSEMTIYVNYMRPDGYKDAYPCNNIVVDETDPETMHFDWTITRNVTQVSGNLRFLVCVKKTDIEGNNVNHWNSDLCSDVRVGEGLECEEQIEQENPDTITAMLTRINMLSEEKANQSDVDELKGDLVGLSEMKSPVIKPTQTSLYPSGYRNGTFTVEGVTSTSSNWAKTVEPLPIPDGVTKLIVTPNTSEVRVHWFTGTPSIKNGIDNSSIMHSCVVISQQSSVDVVDGANCYISFNEKYETPFVPAYEPVISCVYKIVEKVNAISRSVVDAEEDIDELQKNIPLKYDRNNKGVLFDYYIGMTPSSLAVIKDKLYVFQYQSGDGHEEDTNVKVLTIHDDGHLTTDTKTITSNIGHQNTVDYNPSNDTLISSNAGSSDNTEASALYLFEHASTLDRFDIDNCIKIDLSQASLGLQPNAVWGNNEAEKNNIIYIITNYYAGKIPMWEVNNVNNFPSNQQNKRFLYIIKLGIGSEDLSANEDGYGTFSESTTYNGTFQIIKRHDFDFALDEAVNDTVAINGDVYYVPTKVMTGCPIVKISTSNFGEKLEVEKLYVESLLHPAREKEGIAYNDRYIFIGSVASRIYTLPIESIY